MSYYGPANHPGLTDEMRKQILADEIASRKASLKHLRGLQRRGHSLFPGLIDDTKGQLKAAKRELKSI